MLIDHVGALFFPEVSIFRIVGRIAFPIFCYTLVEGFFHTKNVKGYLIRLGMFAILSEIPYDLAFSNKVIDIEGQNIFFTLFFGVLMMWLVSETSSYVVKSIIAIALLIICRGLQVDYANMGILIIFAFYIFRGNKVKQLLSAGLVMLLLSRGLQLFALSAFIPIWFYNYKRGPKMKLFFYLFYPLHLILLYLLTFAI